MSIDASTLPVSPVFVIAVLGYAAIAALLTGPTIASRELARSGWHEDCQANLVAEIAANSRPERIIPQVPDVGGLLCRVYPELGDLCGLIPDPNATARETETRLRAAEQDRLRQAASGTANQCTCAEQVYIEDQRVSLALYAASGRLVTPIAVSGREAALSRAVKSPVCARQLEGQR